MSMRTTRESMGIIIGTDLGFYGDIGVLNSPFEAAPTGMAANPTMLRMPSPNAL